MAAGSRCHSRAVSPRSWITRGGRPAVGAAPFFHQPGWIIIPSSRGRTEGGRKVLASWRTPIRQGSRSGCYHVGRHRGGAQAGPEERQAMMDVQPGGMGGRATVEVEHWCQGCKAQHGAASWYYQSTKGLGRWYMCGERYNALATKAEWRALDPTDPIETSDEQIRYCYYCDTPIGGIREWEQGYHDACVPKPSKSRRGSARRGGGRRGSTRSSSRRGRR